MVMIMTTIIMLSPRRRSVVFLLALLFLSAEMGINRISSHCLLSKISFYSWCCINMTFFFTVNIKSLEWDTPPPHSCTSCFGTCSYWCWCRWRFYITSSARQDISWIVFCLGTALRLMLQPIQHNNFSGMKDVEEETINHQVLEARNQRRKDAKKSE